MIGRANPDELAGPIGRDAARPGRALTAASHRGRFARGIERLSTRYRRMSLYARVVAINAAIVTGATCALVLTPATVGYPISVTEAAVLVAGVVLVLGANASVLKISFGGLVQTVARMETVDLVRPKERLPLVGGPETRAVAAGLNQMLARLEQERRRNSLQTLAALEGERRRIAQELHDEVGQRLTGMLLQLGNLVSDAPRELRPRVRGVQEEARATLDEVGVLAWQLRPVILDDLSLLRALEALVTSLGDQTPAIRVRSSLPSALPGIDAEAELAIYRVAQEALTNAVRHAGARHIVLAVAVDARRLSISVTDDGIGISPAQAEGAGLRGMRERAFAVRGSLTIETQPRQGVRVSLELPLPGGGT